jgi:hypothetical protein
VTGTVKDSGREFVFRQLYVSLRFSGGRVPSSRTTTTTETCVILSSPADPRDDEIKEDMCQVRGYLYK